MKRPPALLSVGLILVALALACGTAEPAPTAQPPSPPRPVPSDRHVIQVAEILGVAQPTPAPTPKPCPGGPTREESVVNQDLGGSGVYAFNPEALAFSVGDCVQFTITAETELHTFTVDDLGIDKSLDGGETITFTFTFEQAGVFRLVCIPHEANGMVGTITVQ